MKPMPSSRSSALPRNLARRELRIINITPFLPAHQKELAQDLRWLHRNSGVTDVAFIMPLHPEEPRPGMAKAERLRDLFSAMRAALEGSGPRVGILLQSTMGHRPGSESPYQRKVNAKGIETAGFCPLDPGFQNYIRQAVEIVASAQPAFMLVDDDFRLAQNGAPGCYCKLHLAAFQKITGRGFDCAGLVKALKADRHLRGQWDAVLRDSLVAAARAIRAGIDAVDKKMPCGFCICDAGGMELQYAHAIEKILAGGNPQFVRVNTAWYMGNDPRGLLGRIYWTSAQMRVMRDMPEILAESDTCPHSRYYTPAKALDAQIVFSILHGCTGLKLWITRLKEWQPAGGAAYRKVLKDNIAGYQELCRLVPHVDWAGPNTPQPREIRDIPAAGNPIRTGNWACSILARLGIPMVVGHNAQSKITMLAGQECDLFDNAEIKAFLRGGVLLDGPAAVTLCQRGFGNLLGINAAMPDDWKCSFERMNGDVLNGPAAGKVVTISALNAGTAVRLIPGAKTTRMLSDLYKIPFYRSPDEQAVGAGLTLFANRLGGRVAVYAAAIGVPPFMDENRREQLVRVLGWLNRKPLPVVTVADIDIYAMHGTIARAVGGGELLALFNGNMDNLDQLRLRLGGASAKHIEKLDGRGVWRPLKWQPAADIKGDIVVQTLLASAVPLILRIRRRAGT